MAQSRASSLVLILLLVVHGLLLSWAVIGLVEWFFAAPWPPLTNPLFPDWLNMAQWVTVLSGALVFLGGHLRRWRHTPVGVAVAYTAMATVCAIQTIGYLEHDLRFVGMAVEYVAYLAIVLWLFHRRAVLERSPAGQRA